MSKRRISLVMMMMLLITSLSYANGQETIPYRVEVGFIKTIHISFHNIVELVVQHNQLEIAKNCHRHK